MAYQARLKDYERLLASLSHRAERRATARGYNIEFDDLFQEAKATFVVALDKFDATMNIKFSTYLWTAVKNNLQRFEKVYGKGQQSSTSMDQEFGEDGGSLHDILTDTNETIEERIDQMHIDSGKFATLSDNAKRVVAVLDTNSPELSREIKRMEAFRLVCKSQGKAAASRVLDVHTACVILGYSTAQTRLVKQEFKELMSKPVIESVLLSEPCYSCGSTTFACGKCEAAFKIGDILYG